MYSTRTQIKKPGPNDRQNNRYARCGAVITQSLIKTGVLPTANELCEKLNISLNSAVYSLQAWVAFRPFIEKIQDIENNPGGDNKALREFLLKAAEAELSGDVKGFISEVRR